MHWLQMLDAELFRWVNLSLANPVLDFLMPLFSGNELSLAVLRPVLVFAALLLIWKGGLRGLVCLLMLCIVLGIGDGVICNGLKHAIGRPRPFLAFPDVHCLAGRGGSGSMPSSHAANWFSAATVLFLYYRRSLWFMLPTASLVGFSRIYNGVHYPSDVLVGAAIGVAYGLGIIWLMNGIWLQVGKRWFPLWWAEFPSLLGRPRRQRSSDEGPLEGEEPACGEDDAPDFPMPPPKTKGIAPAGFVPPHVVQDQQWLRLSYVLIGVLLLARFAYLASGTIQLTEDEAYQWVWSKHLAISYYSKPPLIAFTQFAGTSIAGDTVLGVRLFSPIIAAVLSFIILRFFAREFNARAGFLLLLVVTATPLLGVGAVLMTVDPLSVLFWTAAMIAGWRAVQEKALTCDWLWVGLWMGLGFLSKYTALAQLICLALFFLVWPPARKQLRRPGPYLALVVTLLLTTPVLVWNYQHGWITLSHLADNAGAHERWKPTLRYLADFLGSEFALLNPVFFVGFVWAAVALWKGRRHDGRLVYLFCMGGPLFLGYLLHSFKGRVLPNWIAPSVVPLLCLMVAYWDTRLRLGAKGVRAWFGCGMVVGLVMVILGHQTDLVQRLTGRYLPVNLDPLHRVREWDTTARVIDAARQTLAAEGKPVFIITDHYGMAGQAQFNLPEARALIKTEPLVYFHSSPVPLNQFFYWRGYQERKGQNAIFVIELDRSSPEPVPPAPVLLSEFESVTDMGVSNVMYHGQLLRPLQFYACRGLR